MKKNQKILGGIMLLLAVALTLGGVFSEILPMEISQFLYGGEGFMAVLGVAAGAGETVQGTVTHESVESATTDIHELDLDPVMVKIRPSDTPLDTICREMGNTRNTKSIETGGFEIGTREIIDTVTTATTASATKTVTLVVDNVDMWTKNSTLFVHEVPGGDGKLLGLFIYELDVSNSSIKCLTLNPAASSPFIPVIPAGSKLQRLGSAVNELTAQVQAYSILPSDRTNNCQIFMTLVEQGVVEGLAKKKVSNLDFSTFREQAIWDFKREIESSYLFGTKSKAFDPISKETIYTCDGLWNQIDKNFELPNTITDDKYIDMTKYIFEDNNGSPRKILFAGNGLIADMAKSAQFQRQLEAGKTEVIYGITFNTIKTNFGELLIKPHQLFKENYYNSGIALDPSFLSKEVYEKLQSKKMNFDETGVRRSTGERLLEHSCPFVQNLPAHSRITRPSA